MVWMLYYALSKIVTTINPNHSLWDHSTTCIPPHTLGVISVLQSVSDDDLPTPQNHLSPPLPST